MKKSDLVHVTIHDLLLLTAGVCLVYAAPTLTDFIEKSISVRLDGDKQSS